MSVGYTFDEQMRQKALKLLEVIKKDENEFRGNMKHRSELNELIMEIQKPLVEKLNRIAAIL